MKPVEVRSSIKRAESLGYRLTTRHQPAVELEDPDWIVVIRTPDGRTLFPEAIDDQEDKARHRAALRVEQDIASWEGVDA
jgi:hypothetical protein